MSNGLMEYRLPSAKIEILCDNNSVKFRNSLDAILKITKNEGISHLYTGLGVTLWMAIPATVLYFSTYDICRNWSLEKFSSNKNGAMYQLTPMFCGVTARTFAACVISPLELLRTQMQVKKKQSLSLPRQNQIKSTDG